MEKNIPKFYLISLSLFIFTISTFSQQWTDPINISTLPGIDYQPDLCIDKNGVLHCVFTHKLASNWHKIYYTKSTNDGQTWTTPEDISLNPDTSLMFPQIVADTNNILYVSYDYNIMNPSATLIKLNTFDGNQWSAPFVVSEGMYNSDYNKLCVDHNNRIYVFWGYLDHWTNYRYYENEQWSNVFSPYPEQGSLETMAIVIDDENNLHCIGWGINNGGGPYVIYFSYIYDDIWTVWTIISSSTNLWSVGGADIDLLIDNFPAITYRQKTYGTVPNSDSTMYTFFDGSSWSLPELVINDPYEQKIAIDPYNRVHIIDWEKLETGYKLVHYQNFNGLWLGYIIDEAQIVVANPVIIEKNNILYLVYYICFSSNDCRIRFSKNYLLTGIQQKEILVNEFNIYPNPFTTETTIELGMAKELVLNISVNDLNGKNINTIDERKFSTGMHKYIWNGTDKNGKEVNPGTYLIRLQAGRHVITKPVEKIK